jgi:hypothetical protein
MVVLLGAYLGVVAAGPPGLAGGLVAGILWEWLLRSTARGERVDQLERRVERLERDRN